MFFHKVSSFSSASTLVLLLAFTNTADALALPPTAVLKRASGIDAIAQPAANASTVWKVNDHADVTWITTGAPAQITNPNGTILLGHMSDNGSENLDLQHPLASYVNLTLGKATIEVPDVPTGRYIIVLMGDSGNRSPEFMIQSGSGGAASNNSSDTSSTPTDSSSDSASDPPNTDAA
ncbi:hypothetical protein LENED_001654 [Lentinula edodes]|uniref:Uncharacterized protein n=1 Tax=Lentinula edodes TaxID=5353 RepID=A0A1Q3DZ63_LENED|nr:hypothetical protein LENED_001654 [Lentinula edodes]